MKVISVAFPSADYGPVFKKFGALLITENHGLANIEYLKSEAYCLIDAGRIPKELDIRLEMTKLIDHSERIYPEATNNSIIAINPVSDDDYRFILISMFYDNNENYVVTGGNDINFWKEAFKHFPYANDILYNNLDYIENRTDSVQLWHLGESSPFYHLGFKSSYIMTGNEKLLSELYNMIVEFKVDNNEMYFSTYDDFYIDMKEVDVEELRVRIKNIPPF